MAGAKKSGQRTYQPAAAAYPPQPAPPPPPPPQPPPRSPLPSHCHLLGESTRGRLIVRAVATRGGGAVVPEELSVGGLRCSRRQKSNGKCFHSIFSILCLGRLTVCPFGGSEIPKMLTRTLCLKQSYVIRTSSKIAKHVGRYSYVAHWDM